MAARRERQLELVLGVVGAAFLVATAVGFWAGGPGGAGVAALAMLLAVLVVGLLRVAAVLVARDAPLDWVIALAGAAAVLGVLLVAQYGLEGALGDTVALFVLGAAGVAIGAGVGAAGGTDPPSGLGHGVAAGSIGGLLFVPVATFESVAMQPSLTGVVLLSGVVAPLAFGLLGGLGGALGGMVVLRR